MGECVTKCVLDFLNLGVIPPKFNETHITLILKVKDPKKITKYRPISLSNIVSQIALKVLANRLKVVLPTIISENQSAFMSDRLITDNIFVAFEVMNHISQKRGGVTRETVKNVLCIVKMLVRLPHLIYLLSQLGQIVKHKKIPY